MANKVKNKFLFKRGGYAIAAIALVIAAVVLVNVLVGIFADRMDLEYDLTPDKKNSLSEENEKFIEEVKKDVVIYVLAASEDDYYASGMLQEFYYQYCYIYASTDEYYKQTPKLLNRYADLNDNIEIVYIDPFGTQIGDIFAKYPNEGFMYGDILVTCEFTSSSGKELSNYRRLSVDDIYAKHDASGMAAMKMDYYDINGSYLETSLTSALLSVTSEDTKKVAFISEKSKTEAFAYFRNILELNNFIVEDVGIGENIPADYDVAVICAPTSDFTKEELDVLSIFLENDGNLGKTLLFFGEIQNQNLTNFYNFLAEWGIVAESGIALETNSSLCFPNDPSTYVSMGRTGVPFSVGTRYYSGYNVPMLANKDALNGRTATAFITTNGTSVVIPTTVVASITSLDDLAEFEKVSLATAIISTEEDYDNANQQSIFSHVIAFSSYDFITQEFIEGYKTTVDYVGATLNPLKYATGMNDVSIQIEPKTIESTKETYLVSEKAAEVVKWIFVGIIPICTLAVSIVIFFRRRNK